MKIERIRSLFSLWVRMAGFFGLATSVLLFSDSAKYGWSQGVGYILTWWGGPVVLLSLIVAVVIEFFGKTPER